MSIAGKNFQPAFNLPSYSGHLFSYVIQISPYINSPFLIVCPNLLIASNKIRYKVLTNTLSLLNTLCNLMTLLLITVKILKNNPPFLRQGRLYVYTGINIFMLDIYFRVQIFFHRLYSMVKIYFITHILLKSAYPKTKSTTCQLLISM